jgi:hypothetical protein
MEICRTKRGKTPNQKNYKEIDYTMNCDKSNIRKMNLHVFFFIFFHFPFFIFLPLFFCSFSFLKSTGRRSQTIGQVNLYLPIPCSPTSGTLTEGAAGWRAAWLRHRGGAVRLQMVRWSTGGRGAGSDPTREWNSGGGTSPVHGASGM